MVDARQIAGKPRMVCVATPMYEHKVCYEYHRSYIQSLSLCSSRGFNIGHMAVGGDQFIAKARNRLVRMFLQTSAATDLFFIDDDVGWPPEAFLKFIQRPEDVLCGIYCKKQETLDWPVELLGDQATGELTERDGLVKIQGGPTGFMRIRRHVIETLARNAAKFLDLAPDGSDQEYPEVFYTGTFEFGDKGRRFHGEDWLFCQDVQKAGFEVWADPNIEFTHRGQKVWRATLADSLAIYREKGRAAAKEIAEHGNIGETLPVQDGPPSLQDGEAAGDSGNGPSNGETVQGLPLQA
jgi:hypothetical protein